MSFNWGILIQALTKVPAVVAGVEGIVTEAKSGATKKQLALDALGFANAVADAVVPGVAPQADAAAAVVGQSIDMWVNFFNKKNWGK